MPVEDGQDMSEEELRPRGLWRWPRGRSPGVRDAEEGGTEERARREGIGQVRPPKKEGSDGLE